MAASALLNAAENEMGESIAQELEPEVSTENGTELTEAEKARPEETELGETKVEEARLEEAKVEEAVLEETKVKASSSKKKSGCSKSGRLRSAQKKTNYMAGPIVVRDRLMHELFEKGAAAGVTFVTAPDGFGKTALLNQYVLAVSSKPDRGVARLLDAAGLDEGELYEALKRMCDELEPRMRPLVAIDNMPRLRKSALEVFPSFFRTMRDKGFEFVIAGRPHNYELVGAMGDSHKIGPQAMAVHPQEYPDWARMLSIAGDLDIYKVTQGVPALVARLYAGSAACADYEQFAKAAAEVYRGVLVDLRRDRDSLYRVACMLILGQSGSLRGFERARTRVSAEQWSRLAHDYPVFGIDTQHDRYACLAPGSQAMHELRREIVHMRPLFAVRAVRVALAVGEADKAVSLAHMIEQPQDVLDLVAERPDAFALSGNGPFVREILQKKGDVSAASAPVGLVAALYASSLVGGDFRTARLMAAELRRRSGDIARSLAPEVWMRIEALSLVWKDCPNIELPELDPMFTHGRKDLVAEELELHARTYAELVGGRGSVAPLACTYTVDDVMGDATDVVHILLACDGVLADVFKGEAPEARGLDKKMQKIVGKLLARGLEPVAAHVRMTAALCRMFEGVAVVDERAFIDAGAVAVRTRDFAMQLLCLVGEGWQDLALGHHVNALFRAQQVLKLADFAYGRVIAWARMLECCSTVLNTSRAALADEAALLDLAQQAPTPVDAWTTALRLSGAYLIPELSAWCSLNKESLLAPEMRAMGRQAIHALGNRSHPLGQLLPSWYSVQQEQEAAEGQGAPRVMDQASYPMDLLGQFKISLFGGFQVSRGGHIITSSIWRRKKACILAARLVLAGGAFVSRQVVAEEIWPDKDYRHAREAMYAGLSSLRGAFGQRDDGPQYVLTQGEGVAINNELVSSDTMQFDMLARHILLGGTNVSSRQVIDECLKLEELYAGPLYVPNFGDSTYYMRQRRLYVTKFVDCMMHGISVAVEMDDLPAASWLVEAAMRHDPLREDVVRAAMRVYDLSGRRREVVELYNSHVHCLEEEMHVLPEEETRLAYESIVGRIQDRAMMG
ncbi:MAG: BTAD domain-containing putative transcriptional regulator [Coriobacteriaceae bacterium]|nr:BTAD domain-containing putative transcriptional regulator [Coriobacteriaceae bacterium]